MERAPEAAAAAYALAQQVKPNRDIMQSTITLPEWASYIQGDSPKIPEWASLKTSLKSWRGACTFCYYANGDMTQKPYCREYTCPSNSQPLQLYRDDDVSCFNNYQEPRDRLCILRNFEEGRSNIEAMPRADRESTLRRLLDGAARDASWRKVPLPEMACLNPAKKASVPYTHVHLFQKGLNPDGGVEDHAYCTRFRDASLIQRASEN